MYQSSGTQRESSKGEVLAEERVRWVVALVEDSGVRWVVALVGVETSPLDMSLSVGLDESSYAGALRSSWGLN